MKILSKNNTVLPSSYTTSSDGKSITYMANTELYVEGNPHAKDLFTSKTVTDLTCLISNTANIQAVTDTQVAAWVALKYPII